MARDILARSIIRIVVDFAMAAAYVAVMATALVQEAPHEYLGIALFALVVVHVVLSRRWFMGLARGRYNALRVVRLMAVIGLFACTVAQFASSLVLSKHAFGFLPALPGASWARNVHMLCSYWGFVFAFAHVGLQFRTVLARLGAGGSLGPAATWACRAAFITIACFGAWSFITLELPAYLTGQVQFAFVDSNTPMTLKLAQYASIATLIAGMFYYVAHLLRARAQHRDARGTQDAKE